MRLRRRLLAVLIVLGTYACTQPQPVPSEPGEAIPVPWQCEDIIKRGGRC